MIDDDDNKFVTGLNVWSKHSHSHSHSRSHSHFTKQHPQNQLELCTLVFRTYQKFHIASQNVVYLDEGEWKKVVIWWCTKNDMLCMYVVFDFYIKTLFDHNLPTEIALLSDVTFGYFAIFVFYIRTIILFW